MWKGKGTYRPGWPWPGHWGTTSPTSHSPGDLLQLSLDHQPCLMVGEPGSLWEGLREGWSLQPVLCSSPGWTSVLVHPSPCLGLLMDVSSPWFPLPCSVPTGQKLLARAWLASGLLPAPGFPEPREQLAFRVSWLWLVCGWILVSRTKRGILKKRDIWKQIHKSKP